MSDMPSGTATSVAVDGPLGIRCRPAVDYVTPAFPGGVHQGLAGPWLTLVLTLAGPVVVEMPDRGGVIRRTEFDALLSGLCPAAVKLPMVGEQRGLQIDISPLSLRQILGMPAGEIAYKTVDLADLLGTQANRIVAQLREEPDPYLRVSLVTDILNERMAGSRSADIRPELKRAWSLLMQANGNVRIADVASEIGWSRRHLAQQFTREFGLGPKELSRVIRFSHAVNLVRQQSSPNLSGVAMRAGYADQAHFCAEWKVFAGCSASEWIRRELPFLQDRRQVNAAW